MTPTASRTRSAYPVDDAYRVFADIPYGGRVVAFLSGPIGLFVMGMYAMGMLLLVFRRRPMTTTSCRRRPTVWPTRTSRP